MYVYVSWKMIGNTEYVPSFDSGSSLLYILFLAMRSYLQQFAMVGGGTAATVGCS